MHRFQKEIENVEQAIEDLIVSDDGQQTVDAADLVRETLGAFADSVCTAAVQQTSEILVIKINDALASMAKGEG